MLIQDRIKIIIKANNLSASEFADKVGVKRSNLSHVLSGRNKPSLDFLSKVISIFPKVNAAWLVAGSTQTGDFMGGDSVKVESVNSPVYPKLNKEEVEPDHLEVKKIVTFFTDDTFSIYYPSKK